MAHDRTYDHRETEDCQTVFLSAAVGPYAEGMLLCDVIADLWRRLRQVQADWSHGFTVFGLDAFLAPYDPGTLTGQLGIFGIDACVLTPNTDSFGLDAAIVSPTPVEITGSMGLNAYIHDAGGLGVGQLTDPIDDTTTIIHVSNYGDFPSECPFLVQIDNEIMLVVDGCGTDTWTVIRGYNGTTAAAHDGGSLAAAC